MKRSWNDLHRIINDILDVADTNKSEDIKMDMIGAILENEFNIEIEKYRLISVEHINLSLEGFEIWEGTFQDMEQLRYQHKEVNIYANITNIDDEVRVYPYPFNTLYCAEDYELSSNIDIDILEYFKKMILKEKKNLGGK